ncbi:Tautomerase/MIF superfamily [Radiomyces spectabilis]|uniref:Tautomerase/MIF superfamily n=1 Tax=Radiomyces spectabilis TaxID=64574 RepID=UPI0022206D2D|nr:Tautomerase/MIF superfamily [Radiomyces spectabilis]KAI8381541.1 Tautomerase/MIF superfamily [Radiomyces spectabilis]
MPILEITSQRSPKDLNAFLKKLSSVFAEHIGKPESYCLVTFVRVDQLYFAGTPDAGFIAKVGSIGHIDRERNARLTAAITAEMKRELGVSDDRGYFLFTDFPSDNIGFKSTSFSDLIR